MRYLFIIIYNKEIGELRDQMHKSLYRVYRPKVFEEVLGQKLIATALKNAINENKVAHAYLFAGSSGVGKTSLAKIFAKAINCVKTNKPCLECEICQLINNNKTTDVIEMDAASNNGVDEIKNLIENVQYPPLECKYKVYIIDEVHMLSNSAFNALLKTLEEPPANTIFILATTEEHKIPETILTRCQKFYFLKVANKEIVSLLENIVKEENKPYEKPALELIANMASGGVRLAISILEKCLSLPEKLTPNVVNKTYGLLAKEDVKLLCEAIYNQDQKVIFEMFSKISTLSSNYLRISEEILSFLKEVLILKMNQDYNFKFINPNDSFSFDSDFIYNFLDLITKSMQELRFTNSPQLLFEILILQALKLNNSNQTLTTDVNQEKAPKPSKIKPEKEEIKQQENSVQEQMSSQTNKTSQTKSLPQMDSLFATNNNSNNTGQKKVSHESKEPDTIPSTPDSKTISDDQKKLINETQKSDQEKETKDGSTPPPEKTKIDDDIAKEINQEKEALVEDIAKNLVVEEEEESETKPHLEKEIASEHIKLENEIFNVLLRAEKKYKEFFKTKWEGLAKYLEVPENARWIKMIHNSKIIAATNNVLILLFEYEPSADILNGENKNQEFLRLMYQIFGQDILFMGVWIELWDKIKNDFVYKKNNNQLPPYVEVFIPKAQLEVNKKKVDKNLENLKEVFGDNIVEVE